MLATNNHVKKVDIRGYSLGPQIDFAAGNQRLCLHLGPRTARIEVLLFFSIIRVDKAEH